MKEIAYSICAVLVIIGAIGHLATHASMYHNHKWPFKFLIWGFVFWVLGFISSSGG
jgi:hypothetical protein